MSSAPKVEVKSRENLARSPVTNRLKPERVQDGLRKLPNWRQSRDGRSLVRTFRFADTGAPLAFAGFVLTLAGQEEHHPIVTLHKGTVECKLTTPAAGGITVRDFDMARRISLLG
ncbi:MAG TPA: 4a-hydroxytetrahydrobiopterin dehydratase [Thermoanaerobaculia bacterium]|nr:4a-hydroxytetrahydrobiopterin dehydratase [Thermoanaerobaculia bacterium]